MDLRRLYALFLEHPHICTDSRLVQPGDKVIIMAYAQMTPEEAQTHKPVVLLLGDNNQILEKLSERAGQIIE